MGVELKTLFPAALLLLGLPTAAIAMPVSTFLVKAEALQKKGPLALMSSDLKSLMNQIKQDAMALRAENKAAEAAGRKKAYCTPVAGVKMSNRDILAAMNSVPAQRRASTDTRDALRGYFARRFPCAA